MEIREDILIDQALQGHQSAFASLLSMYWSDVYYYLLGRHLCDEDAEDLCIETFSKAFEKLSTYDPQYKFKTWILNIAKHHYIDFVRKNAPLMSMFSEKIQIDSDYDMDVVGEDTPESAMIHHQALENVRSAVEYLPPRYREVMRLRYLEEMSVQEISDKMEISISNVKIILMRGRKMLLKGLD